MLEGGIVGVKGERDGLKGETVQLQQHVQYLEGQLTSARNTCDDLQREMKLLNQQIQQLEFALIGANKHSAVISQEPLEPSEDLVHTEVTQAILFVLLCSLSCSLSSSLFWLHYHLGSSTALRSSAL